MVGATTRVVHATTATTQREPRTLATDLKVDRRMTTTQTSLGELAAQHPSAPRVFLRHHLDFCCGGHRSLADACARAGLDPDTVLTELATEAAREGGDVTRWDRTNPVVLVDHLESHYHAAHRRDLPSLVEAARRVERVHAGKPEVPAGLADELTAFADELVDHMSKEERVLFPLIRRGARGEAVAMPIHVMEREHDAHGHRLARVRELAYDFAPPAHACATWRALYAGLATLEAELMQHIHLENHVLFARL